MKINEQSFTDSCNNSSNSSSLEKDYQEMGSIRTSVEDGVVFVKRSSFRCFPIEMDLNPLRMILAEILGTFMLVFCVCGIIASTQLLRGEVGLMEYASTAGLTVIIIIFSIGPISGAHVNPAVTIAFAAYGHFPWSRVPFYVIAQTIGSILATYVGRSIYGIKTDLMITQPLKSCAAAFWVELIATFIIMFLAAALTYQAQYVGPLSGFVIGISIGLAVLITGPMSGGSMNPARSIGPAIVSWNFKDLWIYITAPTIGAVAGAFTFHVLRIPCLPCTPTSPTNPTIVVTS